MKDAYRLKFLFILPENEVKMKLNLSSFVLYYYQFETYEVINDDDKSTSGSFRLFIQV